ncbi:MAG: aldo/keto reductase [Spirochaetaceae bacterium]|nr:aldo/keto reductase [Spirochaetaceae bacterium]
MKYRILGSTEIEVSVIGLGTWQFGGEWGKDFTQNEVDKIIGTAKDSGINFIDTAECYGDHLSESLIGKSIKSEREKWIVATKFGHHYHGFMERTRHFDPVDVVRQLDLSLESLKTDYIDIYQMHSSKNDEFQNEGIWEELLKQKEKGKIRHIGLSISGNDNIFQTSRSKEIGAETIQVVYNRLDRIPEAAVFPKCRELNLGVLARVPLASGLLSGKYKPGHIFTGTNVRAMRSQDKINKELNEVEIIMRDEVPQGISMATWALAWCLKNNVVTSVIPGCKNPGQVISNAAAADLIE